MPIKGPDFTERPPAQSDAFMGVSASGRMANLLLEPVMEPGQLALSIATVYALTSLVRVQASLLAGQQS